MTKTNAQHASRRLSGAATESLAEPSAGSRAGAHLRRGPGRASSCPVSQARPACAHSHKPRSLCPDLACLRHRSACTSAPKREPRSHSCRIEGGPVRGAVTLPDVVAVGQTMPKQPECWSGPDADGVERPSAPDPPMCGLSACQGVARMPSRSPVCFAGLSAVACHEHGTGLTGFLPGSWDHLGCQSWGHRARRIGGSLVGSLTRRVMSVGVEVIERGIPGGQRG